MKTTKCICNLINVSIDNKRLMNKANTKPNVYVRATSLAFRLVCFETKLINLSAVLNVSSNYQNTTRKSQQNYELQLKFLYCMETFQQYNSSNGKLLNKTSSMIKRMLSTINKQKYTIWKPTI